MKTPRTAQASLSSRPSKTAAAVDRAAFSLAPPHDPVVGFGTASDSAGRGRGVARAPDIPDAPVRHGGAKQGFQRQLRLLTVFTTAKQLAVSDKTVWRWIQRGELPVHRFGRSVRVAEDDLAAFVGRHRR